MGRARRAKQARRVAGIRTTRVPSARCPACNTALDAATGVAFGSSTGPRPSPGAVMMCAYCTTTLAFTDDMALRLATDEDLAGLHPEARAVLDGYARKIRQ